MSFYEELVRLSESEEGEKLLQDISLKYQNEERIRLTQLERLKENKAIYLIFNHDVINCSWHLPVYDAYRFVNAMLEYGFKMEI